MNWSGFIISTPYILSAVISAAISLYALKRRDLPGAKFFGFLAGFEVIWTAGYIIQNLSPDLSGKLLWNNFQFLGAVGAPLMYFRFGYAYTGRSIKSSTWRIIIALAAAILLLIWTDGLHHLFRIDPHLVPGKPFSLLVFANGPVFILYPFFGYLLLIVGTYVLVNNYIYAPRAYRLQVATVLIGILIPWIATLLTWLSLIPAQLEDITPLTFVVSNFVVAWALFRHHLFDVVPVAYDTLVESMEDGVILLDKETRIVDMNPAAQRFFDLPINKVLGELFFKTLPLFKTVIPDLHDDPTHQQEFTLFVSGVQRHFETRVSYIYDNRRFVDGNLIVLRDITARKLTEEKLQKLAVTDPLTQIYNRRYFFDIAEREFERSIRSAHPLAIIIFDIDHFKNVNDTYGHMVGDQVLQSLTKLCLKSLRSYDVMARYGGEEFIIMLPETNVHQALQAGERLRTKIAGAPIATKAGPAEITISLGIASIQGSNDLTLDKLIDRADQALLMVKQRGRNQVRVWGEETLKVKKTKEDLT